MLSLAITGSTVAELKQKAFEALGITEPAQASLPLAGTSVAADAAAAVSDIRAASPMAAMAQAAKAGATRTRRTKAEIEAERQSKNQGASAAQTIQNNFEANDEAAEVSEEALAQADHDVLGEEPAVVEEKITHDTCKALMKQVIDKHGMDRAINIIKRFKVAKVPELPPESLEMFTFACKDALK